jgi:hypothetical protein
MKLRVMAEGDDGALTGHKASTLQFSPDDTPVH